MVTLVPHTRAISVEEMSEERPRCASTYAIRRAEMKWGNEHARGSINDTDHVFVYARLAYGVKWTGNTYLGHYRLSSRLRHG